MVDWSDTAALLREKRRRQWNEAQRRRRARFYAAGLDYRGEPLRQLPRSRTSQWHAKRQRRIPTAQRSTSEVRYAVLWLLSAGPQPAPVIARRLGWTLGATMQVARRMTLAGVVTRTKRYNPESGHMVYWYAVKAPIVWD